MAACSVGCPNATGAQVGEGVRLVSPLPQYAVTNDQAQCFIWGSSVDSAETGADGLITVRGSSRADGDYLISADAIEALMALEEEMKARLTYRLIKARQQGIEFPEVDHSLVEEVRVADTTEVHKRAAQLLGYVAAKTSTIGQHVRIYPDDAGALAWSESTGPGEITYLLEYLAERKWVDVWSSGPDYRITVDGFTHHEAQRTFQESSQAFVAMWFDSSMDDVYTEGIRPAIEESGYEALRIDYTEHINKIDDEVIKEIRKSRFVVADFTSGDCGARGNVYFEAGFARGLDIPVIWTCQGNQVNDAHFDTRQFNHIAWNDPD